MSAANAFGMPASGWFKSGLNSGAASSISASMAASSMRGVGAQSCAVWLIDRRTGSTHRVNGRPFVVFTHRPDLAIAEMMEGRDPEVWSTRVEAVGWEGKK